MARPPVPYRSDCGTLWQSQTVVRGTLPGTKNFGKNLTHTLPPVVADLSSAAGKLGWDGSYEHDRYEQLRARIETVMDEIRIAQTVLPPRKIRSLEYLLEGASVQLDAIVAIHDRWRLRPEGTFSLSYGDTLRDFPAAAHWQDCVNPGNILAPPGPHYGFEVPARGRAGTVICPGRVEIQQRPKDRKAIVELYRDAARWIRCAEWSLWREMLYAQALTAWRLTPEGQAQRTTPEPPPTRDQGTRVTPPPTRGGVRVTPTPPPEDPPDVTLPDPPPGMPEPPPLPDHVGPHTVGTPPRPTHSTMRSTGETAFALVGIAAVGYLGWKAFGKI